MNNIIVRTDGNEINDKSIIAKEMSCWFLEEWNKCATNQGLESWDNCPLHAKKCEVRA